MTAIDVDTMPTSSPFTRSNTHAGHDEVLSPTSSWSFRCAMPSGRVTSRPIISSAATTRITCAHHRPGIRSARRRPLALKPSQQATPSDTASELHPHTRAQRV
jgi:hypothetical protein